MKTVGWYVIETEVLRAVLAACEGEDPETDRLFREEIARREAEELQRSRAALS
jgi:hypothetical protein